MSNTREKNTPDTTTAATAAVTFPKTIPLPSGISATQTRPLKGRDAATAHRIAGEASPIEFGAAVMAQVVQLNGQPAVMEDLLDLDMDDLNALSEAVVGKSVSSTRKP